MKNETHNQEAAIMAKQLPLKVFNSWYKGSMYKASTDELSIIEHANHPVERVMLVFNVWKEGKMLIE
jgi:hypothetical protein